MKNKCLFIIAIIAILIFFSRPIGNLLLLAEGSGYIPNKSSLFDFEVTHIEDGSGGYWRSGSDNKYYYYFSPIEKYTYFYIEKDNKCPNFDKLNYETWCSAVKVKQY